MLHPNQLVVEISTGIPLKGLIILTFIHVFKKFSKCKHSPSCGYYIAEESDKKLLLIRRFKLWLPQFPLLYILYFFYFIKSSLSKNVGTFSNKLSIKLPFSKKRKYQSIILQKRKVSLSFKRVLLLSNLTGKKRLDGINFLLDMPQPTRLNTNLIVIDIIVYFHHSDDSCLMLRGAFLRFLRRAT